MRRVNTEILLAVITFSVLSVEDKDKLKKVKRYQTETSQRSMSPTVRECACEVAIPAGDEPAV